MPVIGYGTWKINDLDAEDLTYNAIKIGYRHIDTASIYRNEAGIGKGIQKSKLSRSDLFITTKVWFDATSSEQVTKQFEKSCQYLKTDYIDLYLIHWPNKYTEIQWRALESLYESKKVKAIGVCNFNQSHLKELMKYAKYNPVINQIEMHPRFTQKELLAFNSEHSIITEAWSPLMKARILQNPIIEKIAKKHHKSEAQIVLKWHLQNDVVVIPKTTHSHRMKENLALFDFELTKDDVDKINQLNMDERIGGNPDTYAQEKSE